MRRFSGPSMCVERYVVGQCMKQPDFSVCLYIKLCCYGFRPQCVQFESNSRDSLVNWFDQFSAPSLSPCEGRSSVNPRRRMDTHYYVNRQSSWRQAISFQEAESYYSRQTRVVSFSSTRTLLSDHLTSRDDLVTVATVAAYSVMCRPIYSYDSNYRHIDGSEHRLVVKEKQQTCVLLADFSRAACFCWICG